MRQNATLLTIALLLGPLLYIQAQPSYGTSTFSTNVGIISAVAPSPATGSIDGWIFTFYSAENVSIININGNINLAATPNPGGIWQRVEIKSENGLKFKLNDLNFRVITAGLVGKTFQLTGYRNGALVEGATANSPAINAVQTTVNIDVTNNSAFGNIDEFRLTQTGVAGQGNLAIEDITISQSVLPVKWTQPLSVVKYGTDRIRLSWSVAEQIGNERFVIERSSDGAQFQALENIAITNANDYAFVDNSPLNGINYYRIKQIDADGSFYLSNTRRIVLNKSGAYKVYPNPVVNHLHIENIEVGKKVNIADVGGKIVFNGKSSSDKMMIDLSGLESGVYFLRVEGEEGVRKVVKK